MTRHPSMTGIEMSIRMRAGAQPSRVARLPTRSVPHDMKAWRDNQHFHNSRKSG